MKCFLNIFVLVFFSLNLYSIDISKHILDNGLKVYISTNDRASICAYSITFNVGSSCEKKGITGISHILEHLMFKQLEGYEIGDIDKIISSIGGVGFNANTDRDYTNYLVQVPCRHLKKILEIDRDRLTKLRITQASLDIEKKVVLSERKMRLENSAFGKMTYYLNQSLLSGTTYSHPVIGTSYDIKHYKVSDVMNYYHKHYTPNNATIVIVAGSYDTKKILKDIKNTLGDIPAGPKPECLGVPIKSIYKEKLLVNTDTQNDRIMLSYLFNIDNSDEVFLAYILEDMLRMGSSPLLNRIFYDTGIAFTDTYIQILKNKTAVLNLFAVSMDKKHKWQEIEKKMDTIKDLLVENLEEEFLRVWNLKKMLFYKSFEENDNLRHLIKDAIIYYGSFSKLESFYLKTNNEILKNLKNLVLKVFAGKKSIAISRGVK